MRLLELCVNDLTGGIVVQSAIVTFYHYNHFTSKTDVVLEQGRIGLLNIFCDIMLCGFSGLECVDPPFSKNLWGANSGLHPFMPITELHQEKYGHRHQVVKKK